MKTPVSTAQRIVLRWLLVGACFCVGLSAGMSVSPNDISTSTISPLNDNSTGVHTSPNTDTRPTVPVSTDGNNFTRLTGSILIIDGTTTTEAATNSTEAPQERDSYVNLAIIPGLLVLALVIGLCIKGCQWFTKYARREDDEMYEKYATILHEGDTDYDSVDFRSESVTNSNYDTVSSMCSMMRKSPMEEPSSSTFLLGPPESSKLEKLSKSYQLCKETVDGQSTSTRPCDIPLHKDLLRCKNSPDLRMLPQLRRATDSQSKETTPNSVSSPDSQTERTISLSSAEESSASLTVDSESVSCKSPRRNQQYKVSFVTEGCARDTKATNPKDTDILRPIMSRNRAALSMESEGNANDHEISPLKRQTSEPGKHVTSINVRYSYPNVKGKRRAPFVKSESENIGSAHPRRAMMVDRETQTHKTSRRALLRSRSYFSESSADENLPPNRVALSKLTEGGQCGFELAIIADGKLDQPPKAGKDIGSNIPHSRDAQVFSGRKRTKCPKRQTSLDHMKNLINDKNIEIKSLSNSTPSDRFKCFAVGEQGSVYITDESETDGMNSSPGVQLHLAEVHTPPTKSTTRSSLIRADAVDREDCGNDGNGNHLMRKPPILGEKFNRDAVLPLCDSCKSNHHTLHICEDPNVTQSARVNGVVLTSLDNRSNNAFLQKTSLQSSMSGNDSKEEVSLENDPLLGSESSDECGKKMDYSPVSDEMFSSAGSLTSSGCAETTSSGSGFSSSGM